MIKIDEDNYIHMTRGDNGILSIPIEVKAGDKILFVAMYKKGYTKEEILRKEFDVEEDSETLNIEFTEDDTKKFELANKKKIYWYDLSVNNVTVLGYDEDGAKKCYVYPKSEEE